MKDDSKKAHRSLREKLAYCWDEQSRKVERVWLPAITPPSSFRAAADRVDAEKALKAKRRRGIIKP